jgi:hypothetical protein
MHAPARRSRVGRPTPVVPMSVIDGFVPSLGSLTLITALAGCAPTNVNPVAAIQVTETVQQDGQLVFDVPPEQGEICGVRPAGRGCRLSKWAGMCATFFSARPAEFAEDRKGYYLSLRAQGDARPLPQDPPRFPKYASRTYVASGVSTLELNQLAALLSVGERSFDPRWLSEGAGELVATGEPYSATTYRLSSALLGKLAQLSEPGRTSQVARQWDHVSRSQVPTERFRFADDSAQDCISTLEQIVAVAQAAQSEQRELYFVMSLPHNKPVACGTERDCAGYSCGSSAFCAGEAEPICHGATDSCQSGLDCPEGQACLFVAERARFECGGRPACGVSDAAK